MGSEVAGEATPADEASQVRTCWSCIISTGFLRHLLGSASVLGAMGYFCRVKKSQTFFSDP